MVVEIFLDDDEDLIRVYTRFPKQERIYTDLLERDFARNTNKGSGISLWRLSRSTQQEAMDNLYVPLKLKGTAIIKARRLKELGMRFVADHQESGHIAARCSGCNMGLAKEPRCQAENGDCGLFADAGVSLAKTLSEEFMIDVAIEKPVA